MRLTKLSVLVAPLALSLSVAPAAFADQPTSEQPSLGREPQAKHHKHKHKHHKGHHGRKHGRK